MASRNTVSYRSWRELPWLPGILVVIVLPWLPGTKEVIIHGGSCHGFQEHSKLSFMAFMAGVAMASRNTGSYRFAMASRNTGSYRSWRELPWLPGTQEVIIHGELPWLPGTQDVIVHGGSCHGFQEHRKLSFMAGVAMAPRNTGSYRSWRELPWLPGTQDVIVHGGSSHGFQEHRKLSFMAGVPMVIFLLLYIFFHFSRSTHPTGGSFHPSNWWIIPLIQLVDHSTHPTGGSFHPSNWRIIPPIQLEDHSTHPTGGSFHPSNWRIIPPIQLEDHSTHPTGGSFHPSNWRIIPPIQLEDHSTHPTGGLIIMTAYNDTEVYWPCAGF